MLQSDCDNIQRLLAADISPDGVIEIADGAVWRYDINRKLKGKQGGPLGVTGCTVYRAMTRTSDYEPDIGAFAEFRAFTVETTSADVVMSKGAVGSAFNRLIEHGFAAKRRDGRQFSVKLLLPALALTELGEDWVANDFGPNTIAGAIHKPLGQKLLSLFPR